MNNTTTSTNGASITATAKATQEAPRITRCFTTGLLDPMDEVAWGTRTLATSDGAFTQEGAEFPTAWSDTSATITGKSYFRGAKGTAQRETSLRQVITRITDTLTQHGLAQGHLRDTDEAHTFRDELVYLMLHQRAAFNSPVWFNCGVPGSNQPDPDPLLAPDQPAHAAPGLPPVGQVSACFILDVADTMPAISRWIATETEIFRGGSGAGVNISRIREDGAGLSRGGTASGPLSFMRAADATAGSIKSGGTTRRAAKMVVMNDDHPDLMAFITTKAIEEGKARAMGAAGIDMRWGSDNWHNIGFQNANNSVRLTDALMSAATEGRTHRLVSPADGHITRELPAREVLGAIAKATWECGDPGVQFHDTIQSWHTTPNAGPINASNPCSEYMHIDNSACNLASINLLAYLGEDGAFDVAGFTHTVRVLITAMDILVDPARYPTAKIGANTRAYRQLGLGYANLGAMIMCLGHPYDSLQARAWAGAITALMHGTAYTRSAELAGLLGPYQGYPADKATQDEVVARHCREGLALPALDTDTHYTYVRHAAVGALGQAVSAGQGPDRAGYRNSQVTVIAPTGTIGVGPLGCDTTGLEPVYALKVTKRLAGGGTLDLAIGCVARALTRLGYTPDQATQITEHITRHGHAEGAPHLTGEHLAVLDTATTPPGGTRAIAPTGHVTMMAAIQPFISGAMSKTVNLPASCTPSDIEDIYTLAWTAGLKALAVYRDGSKYVQPLGGETPEPEAARPARRRLPDDRASRTHKFAIGDRKGFLTVGLFEDGTPGEVFIQMDQQGSTVNGLMDTIGMLMSYALQYGVPLEQLVTKFTSTRFEPAGFTRNPQVPMTTSVIDYLARVMARDYLPREVATQVGVQFPDPTPDQDETAAPEAPNARAAAGQVALLDLPATGDTCTSCGSSDVRRSGTCKTCASCGTTSGGCG